MKIKNLFTMKQKMNPVVHFEMPANDSKRMAEFYSDVFGWHAQFMGEEMGNYVVVITSDIDENGRPKDAGMINGGFYPRNSNNSQHPSVVIAVDDIKESVKEITKSGGKVLGEPVDIPGIGIYASFIDTENNQLSILQPSMIKK
jgi:uncharacterized protein